MASRELAPHGTGDLRSPGMLLGRAAPLGAYVVVRANFIETREEARDYYRAKLARAHSIKCHGKAITIVFEKDATHLYSGGVSKSVLIPPQELVSRVLGRGVDNRKFSLK